MFLIQFNLFKGVQGHQLLRVEDMLSQSRRNEIKISYINLLVASFIMSAQNSLLGDFHKALFHEACLQGSFYLMIFKFELKFKVKVKPA